MTAPQTIRSGVGLRKATIFALDASGYPAATNATAYEGADISGAKVLEINDPEPRRITHVGDDRVLALDVLPPNEAISGTLTAGKINDVVAAILSPAKSFAVGEAKLYPVGHDERGDENQVALLIYRQAQDTDPDSSTYGARRWEFKLYPRVTIVEMEAGFSDNPEEHTYQLYPQLVTKHVWGTPLAAGTEGVTQAQVFRGISQYKPKLVAFKCNAAATEFLFPTDAPAVSTDKITYWVNGVISTAATKATSGLSFATAPTTDAMLVVLYEVS